MLSPNSRASRRSTVSSRGRRDTRCASLSPAAAAAPASRAARARRWRRRRGGLCPAAAFPRRLPPSSRGAPASESRSSRLSRPRSVPRERRETSECAVSGRSRAGSACLLAGRRWLLPPPPCTPRTPCAGGAGLPRGGDASGDGGRAGLPCSAASTACAPSGSRKINLELPAMDRAMLLMGRGDYKVSWGERVSSQGLVASNAPTSFSSARAAHFRRGPQQGARRPTSPAAPAGGAPARACGRRGASWREPPPAL